MFWQAMGFKNLSKLSSSRTETSQITNKLARMHFHNQKPVDPINSRSKPRSILLLHHFLQRGLHLPISILSGLLNHVKPLQAASYWDLILPFDQSLPSIVGEGVKGHTNLSSVLDIRLVLLVVQFSCKSKKDQCSPAEKCNCFTDSARQEEGSR
jgi:hypothetical protein